MELLPLFERIIINNDFLPSRKGLIVGHYIRRSIYSQIKMFVEMTDLEISIFFLMVRVLYYNSASCSFRIMQRVDISVSKYVLNPPR